MLFYTIYYYLLSNTIYIYIFYLLPTNFNIINNNRNSNSSNDF